MSEKETCIRDYIEEWEDERIECFNKCCDRFADYILFLPRLVMGQKVF